MIDLKIILTFVARAAAWMAWLAFLAYSTTLPWWALGVLWMVGAGLSHMYWFWDIGLTEIQAYRHWSLAVSLVLWPIFCGFRAIPDLAEYLISKLLRVPY